MAKPLKFEQVEAQVDKIYDLVNGRELYFGEVVDAKTTSEHKVLESVATKLEALAARFRDEELAYAGQEVQDLGSDLATVVSDKERLAKLLALAKAGKLDEVIELAD